MVSIDIIQPFSEGEITNINITNGKSVDDDENFLNDEDEGEEEQENSSNQVNLNSRIEKKKKNKNEKIRTSTLLDLEL